MHLQNDILLYKYEHTVISIIAIILCPTIINATFSPEVDLHFI